MPLRLELPTIQNWSCHNCGGCCKQHAIEITEREHDRIVRQGWTADDGVPEKIFERVGSKRENRFRLAHQADGSCVFLDARGLCKIHAKFGEPAKPLACRVYPYAFHPAGDHVVLSLRFSCPSVVANLGTPVKLQRGELADLQRGVVPDGVENIPPPAIHGNEELDWPDTLRIVRGMSAFVSDESIALPIRLVRLDFVTRMLAKATFEKIRGERIDELMSVLISASADEVPKTIEEISPADSLAKTQFRLIVAQYARKDTFAAESQGWAHRLRMLAAGFRFARGKGSTSAMQADLPSVPFAAIEQMSGEIPMEAQSILTRYFFVKLEGLHFAGRAFYSRTMTDGLSALWLMYPVIVYLAKWIAASKHHATVTTEDVSLAITLADHHHGYSPAMNLGNFRKRVEWFAEKEKLASAIGGQSCG